MHITIISKFTEITFLSSQMDRKRYTTANFVWNEENQQNCCCFIDKHDRENYLKIHQYSVFFYSFLWKGVCLRKKKTQKILFSMVFAFIENLPYFNRMTFCLSLRTGCLTLAAISTVVRILIYLSYFCDATSFVYDFVLGPPLNCKIIFFVWNLQKF